MKEMIRKILKKIKNYRDLTTRRERVIKDTFEDWCDHIDGDSINLNKDVNTHFMAVLEKTWNHQEEKIAKLEEENLLLIKHNADLIANEETELRLEKEKTSLLKESICLLAELLDYVPYIDESVRRRFSRIFKKCKELEGGE